jgi:hypothetical protein
MMSDPKIPIKAREKFIMPVKGSATRIVRSGETLDGEALAFAAAHGFLASSVETPPAAANAASLNIARLRARAAHRFRDVETGGAVLPAVAELDA